MELQKTLIQATKDWLRAYGIQFFREIKEKHGRIDAVWNEGGIPHAVHFREGMAVRNFLRAQPECKDWTDHDLDNNWVEVIEEAIK